MEMRIGDLISKLDSLFRNYFSESIAKACQRKMHDFRNNKVTFDLLRAEHREAVNKLIETLISLSEEPIHKSQTAIRHTPKEVQVMLFDRFFNARGTLSKYDPNEITEIPENLGALLRVVLIESWEDIFLKNH